MQKNAEQDPKARNNSIVNVPSKGNSHLKDKLGQGLRSSKARISLVEEDFESSSRPHMGNSKKSAPKKRRKMLVRTY